MWITECYCLFTTSKAANRKSYSTKAPQINFCGAFGLSIKDQKRAPHQFFVPALTFQVIE